MKKLVLVTAQLAAFVLLSELIFAPQAHAQLSYYALSPCRVVDTRQPAAVNGGPKFGENSRRIFQIRGLCGVPVAAKAVWINVTVVNVTSSSWITMWPSNTPMPLASTINFDQYEWSRANGTIMALGTDPLDLSVYNANGTVDVIIDLLGYYQ